MALVFVPVLYSACRATTNGDITSERTDGVRIVVRTLHDRAVFCVTADKGHKIAAGFGVELNTSPSERGIWNEAVPKLVAQDNDNYFHLPLQIDLKSRSDVRGHNVHVKLGSCYMKNYCKVYDFDLQMPAYSDAAGNLFCGD